MSQATANRIKELEAQIEGIAAQHSMLQNKPSKSAYSIQHELRLRDLEESLTAELNAIRPYEVIKNGPAFVVAHNGMFVKDDQDQWLAFETEAHADRWIADAMARDFPEAA